MNSFIEVTDKKTNEKILINTFLIVEVRGNCITTTSGVTTKLGFTNHKYQTLETYEEIMKKLSIR